MSQTEMILDVCCGSRMMWFDKNDKRAIFSDKRQETHILPDKSSKGGVRTLQVNPDVVADFTNLPFPSESFVHVVFDPPHFRRNGEKSWCGLKYGTLKGGWEEEIRKGFEECFRVLSVGGTLVFKWCESDIPLAKVLSLTDNKPLYGNKNPKRVGTHWIVWVKGIDNAPQV